MEKRTTTPEADNSDFLAMQIAANDLKREKGVNASKQCEECLDEFFDDRCSTKDDVFYEEGDGAFEQSYKKTLIVTRKFRGEQE